MYSSTLPCTVVRGLSHPNLLLWRVIMSPTTFLSTCDIFRSSMCQMIVNCQPFFIFLLRICHTHLAWTPLYEGVWQYPPEQYSHLPLKSSLWSRGFLADLAGSADFTEKAHNLIHAPHNTCPTRVEKLHTLRCLIIYCKYVEQKW